MQTSAIILVGFGLFSSPFLWAMSDAFREATADVLKPSYRYSRHQSSVEEQARILAITSLPGYFRPEEIAHLPPGAHIGSSYFLRDDGKNNPVIQEHMQRIMDTAAEKPMLAFPQILDKLVVVTHQNKDLQEATLQVLQSPLYAKTPSLLIVSPQFSFQFPFGEWRPTYIQNGDDEKLGSPFVAKEVIFMGGYSVFCLAITVDNIMLEALRWAVPEITLRFLSKYIYEIEGYGPTLNQLVRKNRVQEKDFFENVEKNVFGFEAMPKFRVQGSFRSTANDLKGSYLVGPSSMRVRIVVEK